MGIVFARSLFLGFDNNHVPPRIHAGPLVPE
jgi:hypothetical protein